MSLCFPTQRASWCALPLAYMICDTLNIPDWNVSMVDIHLRKLLWVYCPEHAGVKGNDRAKRRAGRSAVLRSLRHYLRAQSQGHHTIDRLEERGVERGNARRSSLKGRERASVSETNIGTVSKAALVKLLRDRM